jgi:hypothetical protein
MSNNLDDERTSMVFKLFLKILGIVAVVGFATLAIIVWIRQIQ